MSEHSHAAVLSVFADIVTEHIGALRDALARLARPGASDEDLHQFRVTLRRLRSAWVTFAPVLPRNLVAEWKPRLRTLAASTGPVREWDVLLLDWLPSAQKCLAERDEAGLQWVEAAIRQVMRERDSAWRSLHADLISPDVMSDLAMLEDAVAPLRREDKRAARMGEFAKARAAALRKRALQLGRNPARASVPRLHRARIAAKQWRYLYEAFYPAMGVRASKRYRAHLGRLQEALGEIHDAGVALKRTGRLLEDAPPTAILSAFHIREHVARKRATKSLRWIRRHKAV